MDVEGLFLGGVMYLSLLLGGLLGLYTLWLLVQMAGGTPVRTAVFVSSLGTSLLLSFVGAMIRIAMDSPGYGGRRTVRDRWKQW